MFLLEHYRPSEDEKAMYGQSGIIQQFDDGKVIPDEQHSPRMCHFSEENQFNMSPLRDAFSGLMGRWKLDTTRQPKEIAIFGRFESTSAAGTFGEPKHPERFFGITVLKTAN